MYRAIIVSIIIPFYFALVSVVFGNEVIGKRVLTMGRVSDKISKEQKQLKPIITYLASRLKDIGIECGEVVLVHDNKSVIDYLKDGKLDIVLETPFSAYLYKTKANANPILLVQRKGVGEYNSIVFVRKDSGIHQVEDLKGKVIAFEDPGSTSSYFLPKYSIMANGIGLEKIESVHSVVPGDKIGYVFAGSEINISTWVFFNKVNAGVLSSTDWLDHKDNPEAYREEFEIIYETQNVPRMLVIAREGLDEKLLKRIKEELLNMDKSDEGRNALRKFKVQNFYEPLEGIDDVFKPIEDMLKEASLLEVQ